ncbi:uncharacterized protein LOC128274005 [Anopheles cruzii]|uniref:uncharacterized protein LOC128274005 n=1 Tax=Anopheles cruzii TaxID=68878 RepID=UPI0022EC9397|nr:uncharacterized protein LOC128274005 [Anopheles cruzii]
MGYKANKTSLWLRLALLMVLLACVVHQINARPSAPEQQSRARLLDHLLRARLGASSTHHNRRHQPKKRSADYEDYYDADYKRVQQCYEDEDVNELCQRCSKVTKSALVFPMCCSNEDETMNWCREYVYYGIQT